MTRLYRLFVPAALVAGLVLGSVGCDMSHCSHMGGHSAQTPAATADGKPVKFVNERCPIMGNPIDPAAVPASLVRDYNGQKVAFCCGGCPGMWDLLPAAQKDRKLQAVAIAR